MNPAQPYLTVLEDVAQFDGAWINRRWIQLALTSRLVPYIHRANVIGPKILFGSLLMRMPSGLLGTSEEVLDLYGREYA